MTMCIFVWNFWKVVCYACLFRCQSVPSSLTPVVVARFFVPDTIPSADVRADFFIRKCVNDWYMYIRMIAASFVRKSARRNILNLVAETSMLPVCYSLSVDCAKCRRVCWYFLVAAQSISVHSFRAQNSVVITERFIIIIYRSSYWHCYWLLSFPCASMMITDG